MNETIYDIFKERIQESFSSFPGHFIDYYISVNHVIIQFKFTSQEIAEVIMKAFLPIEIKNPPYISFSIFVSTRDVLKHHIPLDLLEQSPCDETNNYTVFYNYQHTHLHYQLKSTILTLVDLNNDNAYYLVDSLSKMPYYEKACPMRMLFHWLLSKYDMSLIHGAAIAINGDGYLLAGRGGQGKSTLSMLAYVNHCQLIGDDYIVIDHQNNPSAYALYHSIKLNKDMVERFPVMNNYIVNDINLDEKCFLYGSDVKGKSFVRECRLKGILCLNRTNNQEPSVVSTSKIKALSVIGASTVFQMPGVEKSFIKNISSLISRLPVFEFTLSRSIEKNLHGLLTFINEAPLISVILPVYNGEKYILQTISSVLSQSYQNIELIVIPYGSTDNTKEIVTLMNDHRIVYHYQLNAGPGAARNTGVNLSKGLYLAFIDGDDCWYPDKLKKQLFYLRHHLSLAVCYCRHQLLFENPAKNYDWLYEVNHEKKYSFEIPSSLFLKRNVFDRIGLFNEKMKLGEDFDFHQRLKESSLNYDVMVETLFDKLIHDDNLSSNIAMNRKYILSILSEAIVRKRKRDTARISVLITAYNSTSHLISCLDSIHHQTITPYEVIIVDDGSTNDTKNLVLSYKSDLIRYFYQENKGISSARNLGILKSAGNYIAMIDHDDIWVENKLEIQLERLLSDSSIDAVFGFISQFYSGETDMVYRNKYQCPIDPSSARHTGSMLIEKDTLLKVGLFNESLKVGEAIEWMSRFDRLSLTYAMVPDIVMYRRMHQQNYGISFKENRQEYLTLISAIIKEKRNEGH